MAVDLDTGILAPLLVAAVVGGAVLARKVYVLSEQKKALAGKLAALEKKIVRAEEDRKEHLRAATEHYQREIEGQKKEVVDSDRAFSLVVHLVNELENARPGWIEANGLGHLVTRETKTELVITEAPPKRPPPPPRHTKPQL